MFVGVNGFFWGGNEDTSAVSAVYRNIIALNNIDKLQNIKWRYKWNAFSLQSKCEGIKDRRYLSQTTGSEGVSFLFPQLFFSQHRLKQNKNKNNKMN